jgi:hypothetical protein
MCRTRTSIESTEQGILIECSEVDSHNDMDPIVGRSDRVSPSRCCSADARDGRDPPPAAIKSSVWRAAIDGGGGWEPTAATIRDGCPQRPPWV